MILTSELAPFIDEHLQILGFGYLSVSLFLGRWLFIHIRLCLFVNGSFLGAVGLRSCENTIDLA